MKQTLLLSIKQKVADNMRIITMCISLVWPLGLCHQISENSTTPLALEDSLTLELDQLYDRGHINDYSVVIVNESGLHQMG
jgi:hypothetical protein